MSVGPPLGLPSLLLDDQGSKHRHQVKVTAVPSLHVESHSSPFAYSWSWCHLLKQCQGLGHVGLSGLEL